MEKIVFFDGNSILNRAYYAIPPLNDRDGVNVNAVLGFLNIFLKTLEEEKPTGVVVAFDKRGKNFRKQLYEGYKATRKGMPDDLAAQMPILKNILSLMHVKYVEKEGVEADDIIGTLSARFGVSSVIFTGDKDLLQLIDDNTTVVLTKRGVSEVARMDEETTKAETGVSPAQIVDYKALCGDASDNIPGVAGIGQKSAVGLLQEYGDIDNLYKKLDNVKGATLKKLQEGREMAFLSRQLATIIRDADVECSLNECGLPVFDSAVKAELARHDFRSIINRIEFTDGDGKTGSSKTVSVVEITTEKDLISVFDSHPSPREMAFVLSDTIYFAYDADTEYKVVLSDNFLDGMTLSGALILFTPLLNGDVGKIVYDGKGLKRTLAEWGFGIAYIADDVDILQYLTEYHSFKNFDAFLAAHDDESKAACLFAARDEYVEKLKKQGTYGLYTDIELPLYELLFEMEQEGAAVDVNVLKELNVAYTQEIAKLTETAHELAGEKFNVLSPKQLSFILFEKLGLPHGKKTKLGYSTDNEALEAIVDKHPIIDVVLKIRMLTKLNGTYVEAMFPLVKNGKVHTHYNQTLTTTGRLSSSDPNLQNIPARDQGREIRRAFVPSRDLLISADYSQIELRWLAFLSGDEKLQQAFKNDEDIHANVASEIFGVPKEMVVPSLRRTAKAVNFGIIYGISEYGLAKNISQTPAKARQYIATYFERYPKIKIYLDNLVAQAKQDGYATTYLGRRRYFPELKSDNYTLRSFGERAVKNMPMQGSAADLMKIAMLRVADRMKREGLESKMILQIHDEIIVDATFEEREKVETILKEEMEGAMVLSVPFKVSVSSGKNLDEAK